MTKTILIRIFFGAIGISQTEKAVPESGTAVFFTEERESYSRGDNMADIGPAMKSKFDSLSKDLKEEIMKRDVKINSIQDLIKCLDSIVAEG